VVSQLTIHADVMYPFKTQHARSK